MMRKKKNYYNIAYCEGCGKVVPNVVTDVTICNECSRHSIVDVLSELTKQPRLKQ
jgi:hypothetical protein